MAHGCDYSPFFTDFQERMSKQGKLVYSNITKYFTGDRIKKKADSPCALLYTVERTKIAT